MDLSLTPEHRQIQEEARRFCMSELAPHAIAVDRGEKNIFDYWPALAAQGFIAPTWPEEYGGSEVDDISAALIAIEMAKACGSTTLSQGASTLLCGGAILHHGTEAQKKRYLPEMASGKTVGAWGLTEPGAGSDVLGIKTRAREVDGGFVLDGAKTFITNAPVADTFVVYAWTDDPDGHQGMSAFILEKGMKGLDVSAPMHKMGFRGSPTGEIFMSECFVPSENLLGRRGMGFYEATDSLNGERSMAPCLAIGFMERCLELSLGYARERQAFGRPIASFQAMQLKIARMYMDIEHSRSMLFRLLWMKEKGLPFAKEASAAKVFCSEAATRNGMEAVQIHGGYGYTEEYEVERITRDAKLLEIGAGTTEIQLLLIARMLVGEEAGRSRKAAAPDKAAETAETQTETAGAEALKDLAAAYLGSPDWKATLKFVLAGPGGGTWRLVVDGSTATVLEGDGEADTTIHTDAATWSDIQSGKLKAEQAFFKGSLKVEGEMSHAMMLSNKKVFARAAGQPA